MNPETKRRTIAHVMVCAGCCCGRVDKGKPPVPTDWLKANWKAARLQKTVQLTISGCLGPCDLVNVVCIMTDNQQIWLGGLTEANQYEAIYAWASEVTRQGAWIDLPTELMEYSFSRFLPSSASL